jgi:hypothetical protein
MTQTNKLLEMNEHDCNSLLSMRNKILREAEQLGNCTAARNFEVSKSCICYNTAVSSGRRKVFFILK